MKKKLLPFILGCSMLAALPLTAHAVDNPEQDSGNVSYGSFADGATGEEEGETPVITAIPECTLTIPRDTVIKRGARTANIGRVTVDGKYFIKPYYVEVSASRNNFVLVDENSQATPKALVSNPLANQDIIFDVATTRNAAGTSSASDDEPDTTAATAQSQATFVKTGAISLDNSKKSSFTETKACRRFWKNETLVGGQDADYRAGEVSTICGQENVWLRIGTTQWTGDNSGSTPEEQEANLAATKPVGGQYKGKITFTATFRDDFDDTYTGQTPNMTTWAAYPRT